jgi:hypothetical protein
VASPELTNGLCCICFGQLEITTAYTDNQGMWDFHRGRCAYLAGYTAPEHQELSDMFTALIHMNTHEDPRWGITLRLYYKWISSLGLENHDPDQSKG